MSKTRKADTDVGKKIDIINHEDWYDFIVDEEVAELNNTDESEE